MLKSTPKKISFEKSNRNIQNFDEIFLKNVKI